MKKLAVTLIFLLNALLLSGCGGNSGSTSSTETPNILYVVMDDIGVDQIEAFGYGGEAPRICRI